MLKYVAVLLSCHLLSCQASTGGFHNIKKDDSADRKATTTGSTAGTQVQPQPKAEEQKPAGK